MMHRSTKIAIAVSALGVIGAAIVVLLLGHAKPASDTRVRGFVDHGSIVRRGNETKFAVTDGPAHWTVSYDGPLPDTFQEGAQVMVRGHLKNNVFVAEEVFAKCPDTYNTPDGPKPAATFR